MKQFLLFPVIMFTSCLSFAADITPQSLIGSYRLEAKAFSKSATVRLRVTSTKEFEVQRLYPDHESQLCNGTYTMGTESLPDNSYGVATVFKGVFTCPNDRSKTADFDLTFKNLTTRDLEKGAWVQLTSSLASGMTLNAKMKKE